MKFLHEPNLLTVSWPCLGAGALAHCVCKALGPGSWFTSLKGLGLKKTNSFQRVLRDFLGKEDSRVLGWLVLPSSISMDFPSFL